MTMRRTGLLLSAVLAAACNSVEPYDYTLFREHPPRSILVLPPLNNSLEVDASYSYLSTVTQPLAEQGYYVFPVAVVDALMRENGLPTPGEMHTVSLDRIADIFGADSVLFVTLTDWGTSYQVIDSSTRVTAEARLVDVRSGTEIWSGSNTAYYSASSGSGTSRGPAASSTGRSRCCSSRPTGPGPTPGCGSISTGWLTESTPTRSRPSPRAMDSRRRSSSRRPSTSC